MIVLTLWAFYSGSEHAARWNQATENYRLENEQNHLYLKLAFAAEPERYQFAEQIGRPLTPAEEGRAKVLQSMAGSALSMMNLTDCWKTWLPPSPLAALSGGESDRLPTSYLVKGSSVAGTLAVPRLMNPFRENTGLFDLSLLVVVILPLAVIAVLYDLVSREEELKTFKLLQMQSRSVSRVMLSRLGIRVAGLSLAISAPVFIGLLLTGVNVFEPLLLTKFLIWSLIVCLYAGFWAGLCWLVNAFHRPSMTNILILSVLWILLVFVAPSVFVHSLAKSTPVDSVEKLQQEEDRLTAESEQAQDDLLRQEEEYQGDITEELLAEWEERSERLMSDYEQQFQQTVASYHQQIETRIHQTRRWDWLVPALLMKESAAQLAGSSRQHFQGFARQTCEFIADYQQHFQAISQTHDELALEEIEQMPVYKNPDLEMRTDWPEVGRLLGVLFLQGVGLLLLGCLVHRSFTRQI